MHKEAKLKMQTFVAFGLVAVALFLGATICTGRTTRSRQDQTTSGLVSEVSLNYLNYTCIEIDQISHPNAYSAWQQLYEPEQVIFFDLAGPGAIGQSAIFNAPGQLPRLVHAGNPGDHVCLVDNK